MALGLDMPNRGFQAMFIFSTTSQGLNSMDHGEVWTVYEIPLFDHIGKWTLALLFSLRNSGNASKGIQSKSDGCVVNDLNVERFFAQGLLQGSNLKLEVRYFEYFQCTTALFEAKMAREYPLAVSPIKFLSIIY